MMSLDIYHEQEEAAPGAKQIMSSVVDRIGRGIFCLLVLSHMDEVNCVLSVQFQRLCLLLICLCVCVYVYSPPHPVLWLETMGHDWAFTRAYRFHIRLLNLPMLCSKTQCSTNTSDLLMRSFMWAIDLDMNRSQEETGRNINKETAVRYEIWNKHCSVCVLAISFLLYTNRHFENVSSEPKTKLLQCVVTHTIRKHNTEKFSERLCAFLTANTLSHPEQAIFFITQPISSYFSPHMCSFDDTL